MVFTQLKLKIQTESVIQPIHGYRFETRKGFNSADECHSQDFLNARSKLVPTEMPVPDNLPTYKGWACCGEEYKNL